MHNGWTPERRARQRELIRTWRPWDKSTGPRTPAGKEASARNRAASLARAEAELAAAQEKVRRLRGAGGASALVDVLQKLGPAGRIV
jgi:hypothetical protein